MILVDTSVWIDLFAERITAQTSRLLDLTAAEQEIAVGDLVVAEVLQGARDDRHADKLLARFDRFDLVTIVDERVAVEAARHYRLLRAKGVTVRTTIDTLIATRCILDGVPLLYADRDFDPFVAHLGLIPVLVPIVE